MRVLDPVLVAVKKLPPWAVALGAAVALSVALTQRKPSIAPRKPRKIHSLGTKVPIIGDLREMLAHAEQRNDWFTAQCERFGFEPWQINVPGMPRMIVITDPAHVETVMVTQRSNFVKSPQHLDILHDILGTGLVNSEGEQWHHQRKTAAKFFSARTLRLCMMQTMQRNMQRVYNELDAVCGTGRNANLTHLFHQFTMQTFLEVGVGIDEPIIGKNESTAFEAVDEAMVIVMRRRLVPSFVWKLQRFLNIGPEKKLKDLMDGVYAYTKRLIDETLAKGAKGSTDHNNDDKIRTAIDLFVEHSHEDKVGLRSRDLLDFVLNFVIAARDTSSMGTLWFFYRLSKHPDVEAKIRAELVLHLPSMGVSRDGYITADHVKHLVYLEATIKETLRIHPPVPFMMRHVVDDIVLDGDLFVRKGQAVAMPVYAMARNPQIWGPDAAEFRPERWIDENGELISVPPTKFFTFSAGPRICIGMKLAMLNLRILTANLLHRYRFHIDPKNDGSNIYSIVLAMKHELLATVERV